jgi:UDP-N-acetylmuramyl tripeptide synthase
VANADDPLVVWAAGGGSEAESEANSEAKSRVRYVAAGELWREDARGCPACGGRIALGEDGAWSCSCGFSRPQLYARLTADGLEIADGRVVPISLSLPARCNRANAAMAAVAAAVLGTDEAVALEAMAGVSEVEGRFSRITNDGVEARLLLAKNPAGWAELLDLLEGSETPVVVGINARIADGQDPSWLWDVPFERLAGRQLVATGERAADLGVRLKYAGVDHVVVRDQVAALSATGSAQVEYVGNYTAFQQLRRSVAPRRSANGSGRGKR